MDRGKAKIALAAAAALLLVAFGSPRHMAGIEIHAHRLDDRAPQQVQAVVDLGVVGFSFLLTWSRHLAH